ncbi:MAG: ACT domain-containing protein [Candidatus Dormibacteria bacterium]
MPPQRLRLHRGEFSICRLAPGAPVPLWAGESWLSLTRTDQELSLVCPEDHVPTGITRTGPWRVLEVEGPLDHAVVGVLESVLGPLARAAIPVFVVSSYDTDWILVPAGRLRRGLSCLRRQGHMVSRAPG